LDRTDDADSVVALVPEQGDRSLALFAVAFAVVAPRPAAGPTHPLFQLFLGPADAPFPCLVLLGVLDPADELVARQTRDVVPGLERCRIRLQRRAQIGRKLVDHTTWHSCAAHGTTVAARSMQRLQTVQ